MSEGALFVICLCVAGYEAACEEGPGVFAHLLTLASLLVILVTLPLSLFWVVKVVQVTLFC